MKLRSVRQHTLQTPTTNHHPPPPPPSVCAVARTLLASGHECMCHSCHAGVLMCRTSGCQLRTVSCHLLLPLPRYARSPDVLLARGRECKCHSCHGGVLMCRTPACQPTTEPWPLACQWPSTPHSSPSITLPPSHNTPRLFHREPTRSIQYCNRTVSSWRPPPPRNDPSTVRPRTSSPPLRVKAPWRPEVSKRRTHGMNSHY